MAREAELRWTSNAPSGAEAERRSPAAGAPGRARKARIRPPRAAVQRGTQDHQREERQGHAVASATQKPCAIESLPPRYFFCPEPIDQAPCRRPAPSLLACFLPSVRLLLRNLARAPASGFEVVQVGPGHLFATWSVGSMPAVGDRMADVALLGEEDRLAVRRSRGAAAGIRETRGTMQDSNGEDETLSCPASWGIPFPLSPAVLTRILGPYPAGVTLPGARLPTLFSRGRVTSYPAKTPSDSRRSGPAGRSSLKAHFREP